MESVLELNSVESLEPLPDVSAYLSFEAKCIHLSSIICIHSRLYGLYKYADKHITGLPVKRLDDDVDLYIASSSGELINSALDILQAW